MDINMVLLTNGQMIEKMSAHRQGLQHYAFSIFIFNSEKELLLQQRAGHKYHSAGLWTNTCCSHPHSIDLLRLEVEAEQRLMYEMGITCPLRCLFRFSYEADCGGLIENEVDFVFVGYSDEEPVINREEVDAYSWKSLSWIQQDRKLYKEKYTEWFHFILNHYSDRLVNYIRLD